jgi:uncharacterized protein (TIGR00369 family)
MVESLRAPFAVHIGATMAASGDGWVRLHVATGPNHADRWGRVHPGLLTSVMDSVIGIALGNLRGAEAQGRPQATIEMSTSFYAAATPGDAIVAQGRVTRIAEHHAFGEVEARRQADDELLAKARLTFVIPPVRA